MKNRKSDISPDPEASDNNVIDQAAPPAQNGDPVATDAQTQSDATESYPTESDATSDSPRKKLSGAYYYIDSSEEQIAQGSFARTILTVIAFMLQVVVLVMPQGSLEYVTKHYPSYSYVYVLWIIFGMFGVSIWLFVMNATRYKIRKRIPVERAPKRGFARRVFLGTELYIAVHAVTLIMEISFLCFHYDHVGLGGMFISALALGAAVAARQVAHRTLRRAELIPTTD